MKRFLPALYLIFYGFFAPSSFAQTTVPKPQSAPVYLRFDHLPTAAERQKLADEGVQLLAYRGELTYIALLPASWQSSGGERAGMVTAEIAPEDKLAATLQPGIVYGDWAVYGDSLDVNVQIYPHLSITQGAEWLLQEGFRMLKKGNYNGFIQIRVPQTEIQRLIGLSFVQYAELKAPPPAPEDTRGRSLHRANVLDSDLPQGRKYNGSGVSVMVRDDGPVGPHIDFQGRLVNLSETPTGADSNHGDGVAGILAGAGNRNPIVRGMATGAKLYIIDYTPEFQDRTLPLHRSDNVTITNSSYGEGCNMGYTLSAQTVDRQLYENPTLLHIFSAGNSNGTNCKYGAGDQWGNITGGHKMAKNALAVANVAADGNLESSSSRGPASDGRLKPDIAANGQNQSSTDNNHDYQIFSGTSGAAPGIAGCLAQLTQAYKVLNNGRQPDAALLKSAIFNTAIDRGNPGPDFRHGWGQVHAGRALRLLEERRYLSGTVESGGANLHALTIPAGVRQARIMLHWTDPAGTLNATKALVNDLDLAVTNASGQTILPLRLDPSPSVVMLNQPASRGRDSLNTTEQVVITEPAPGVYEVQVRGFAIPFGPQEYVLTWEWGMDEIQLTYPLGGERMAPRSTERVHWDATGGSGGFRLEYSLNSGQTWTRMDSVAADRRFYDWTLPQAVANKARVRVIQSGRASASSAFTIAPVPTGVEIRKVCPDSITVGWQGVSGGDTLAYEAYLLGGQTMQLAGLTRKPEITLPIANAAAPIWASAGVAGANGLSGRRATAVGWQGGLKNCPQRFDLGVRGLDQPAERALIRCGPFEQTIKAAVVNEGKEPLDGAKITYQIDDQPPVSETLPTLAPQQRLIHTFQKPVLFSQTGARRLRIWSEFVNDKVLFNDTLTTTLQIVTEASKEFFTENFDTPNFPPQGWAVVNPDGLITWEQLKDDVVGAKGQKTRATWINCYTYREENQQDMLYLLPVDLSNLPDPALRFDLSYAPYDNTASEGLRIEAFPDCDLSAPPVVLWDKRGNALATTNFFRDFFVPKDSAHWREEIVNLKSLGQKSVILRFVSTNAYGNNIFLDNIAVREMKPLPPIAAMRLSADSLCRNDTLTAFAGSSPLSTYRWVLSGVVGQPSGFSGQGPHRVRYSTPGDKMIRLIVTNPFGVDTIDQKIYVRPFPTAAFSSTQVGLTATFKNESIAAESYMWDFGDGNTSTNVNPTHTYAAPETYAVKLTAINRCRNVETRRNVPVIALSAKETIIWDGLQLQPNPTDGHCVLSFEGTRAEMARISIIDAQGRLVVDMRQRVQTGPNAVKLDARQLPAGLYHVQLQGEQGMQSVPLLVF